MSEYADSFRKARERREKAIAAEIRYVARELGIDKDPEKLDMLSRGMGIAYEAGIEAAEANVLADALHGAENEDADRAHAVARAFEEMYKRGSGSSQ